jgi:hypothetical protein
MLVLVLALVLVLVIVIVIVIDRSPRCVWDGRSPPTPPVPTKLHFVSGTTTGTKLSFKDRARPRQLGNEDQRLPRQ